MIRKREEISNENIKSVNVSRLMDSSISHTTIPTPVDTIITRLVSGFYYIPDYQRRYVWTEEQIVTLIISLMKDIPIPKLYMYNNPQDGRYTIIDGQQRLTSLFFFVKGIYPSSNEERRSKYDFKAISELVDNYKNEKNKESKKTIIGILLKDHGLAIKNYKYQSLDDEKLSFRYEDFNFEEKLKFDNKAFEFGAVFVKEENKDEKENKRIRDQVYTDIFRLLNSAGTPLSSQEIRNGIYYDTDLYKKINMFNSDNIFWREFKKVSFKKDREVRFENVEFLLRLLSLDEYIKIPEKKELKNILRDPFYLGMEYLTLEKYKTYSDLIDKISSDYLDKKSDKLIEKLDIFFSGVALEDISERKVKILNIEAYFLAASKLGLLKSGFKLPHGVLTKEVKSISKTSSKNEILNRVDDAIRNLNELGEYNANKLQ